MLGELMSVSHRFGFLRDHHHAPPSKLSITFPKSISHRLTRLDTLQSVCRVSVCQSAAVCLPASPWRLSVCQPVAGSLTGLCVVRLGGHYMRHLFARCYCLHGGDFIRCCDNFINLGEIRLFPQRRRKWRGKGGVRDLRRCYISRMGEGYIIQELPGTIGTAGPFSSTLMRYAQLMLPAAWWWEPWSVSNAAGFFFQISKLRDVGWYRTYPGVYWAHTASISLQDLERRLKAVPELHGHMVNGVSLKARDEGAIGLPDHISHISIKPLLRLHGKG